MGDGLVEGYHFSSPARISPGCQCAWRHGGISQVIGHFLLLQILMVCDEPLARYTVGFLLCVVHISTCTLVECINIFSVSLSPLSLSLFSIGLSVFVCLAICFSLSFWLCVWLSVSVLSTCLPICLIVCLAVWLSFFRILSRSTFSESDRAIHTHHHTE